MFVNQLHKLLIWTVYSFALGLIIDFGLIGLYNHGYAYLISFYVPILAYINPNYYYWGLPLSFITFGIYLIIITYKFGLYSIPIFIITNVLWEVFPEGLYATIHAESVFFITLVCLTIFSYFILRKHFTLKTSVLYLIPYWLVNTNPQFYTDFKIDGYLIEPLAQVATMFFIYMSLHKK